MQFKVIAPDVEVIGRALAFTASGFRLLPSVGLRYLQRHGLARIGPDGKPKLEPDEWYSQEKWLACFEAIYREVGANTTMEMGRQLGTHYPVTPDVRDVHGALRWLDHGFHMAHRKRGKVMFDAATGQMAEGIGHYGYCREGDRLVRSLCDNPYPCDFDYGILLGLSQRFNPKARVAHEGDSCRKNGLASCTYLISW
jgi:hypothetical protein